MQPLPVRYIKREQIDVQKWDRCIYEAPNGLPYVFSYFLDHMSPGWSALVAGDYSLVMPLTWRQKWGIRYLCQPPFVQQTGIFGSGGIAPDQVEVFLDAVKLRFRFAEIFLNYSNYTSATLVRSNFILGLDCGYELIRRSYKTDLLHNLRAASKEELFYTTGDAATAIEMYKREYSDRLRHIKNDAYTSFAAACTEAGQNDRLVVRSAVEKSGDILSSAVLLRDKRRMVLVLSVTGRNGRKRHANHFLLDQLIREFAGKSVILDFEGSELAGIAHFYKNFGAVNQPYFFYRFNELPPLVRLFKR